MPSSRSRGGRPAAEPSAGPCPSCGSLDTAKAGAEHNGKPRIRCRACGVRSTAPGYRAEDGFTTAPADPLTLWVATSDGAACGCGWSEPAVSYADALDLVQDHRWNAHHLGGPVDV